LHSNKIRILSEEDIRRALPMKDAVEVMKEAFRELSAGRVKMPARAHIDISTYDGTALFMPSYSRFRVSYAFWMAKPEVHWPFLMVRS